MERTLPLLFALSALAFWAAPKLLSRKATTSLTTKKHPVLLGLALLLLLAGLGQTARAAEPPALALTPPMGWNDWAHYQCDYTAQTIVDNARELVKTGLAARGYDTVTIDDCWMQKDRNAQGNLQADPARFPHGMKPVIEAVHKLGLKFGIYEDSGYLTCGGFAGSGEVNGGGRNYFLQDAKLFASWGVDYLKLDGCNLYTPKGESQNEVYRRAYLEESEALRQISRPIVFSESAPAYFQGDPEWYNVLTWVRGYGQLWREGSDIATFDSKHPDRPRFRSVEWNYSYNLPLARFQKPNNWNDADFIIGGDGGMTIPETRSDLALWSMMSAPLILSDNLSKVSPEAISILGNRAVIAIDQDHLGLMATLISRSPQRDILLKPLANGDYAVAVFNRSAATLPVSLPLAELGFAQGSACHASARNLWTGAEEPAVTALTANLVSHDTAIWRIHTDSACGRATRTGAVVRIFPNVWQHKHVAYTRCLTAPGSVEACQGTAAERWTVTASQQLRATSGQCLTAQGNALKLSACTESAAARWHYTLAGNLINGSNHECLTGSDAGALSLAACGHNLDTQIWALPTRLPR